MSESLKDKTVKGVGWNAADAILSYGTTFIVGLVLARMLTPSEYGLIGIATVFTSVLLGMVDSGFSNAIIRKQNATDRDYSTMFLTNIAISFLLYALLFVTAPNIAYFFERKELVLLIQVLGLLLPIQAISIVQYTRLSKRLDFKTKTEASFIAAVISGVLGIICAKAGLGVWALVVQQLSNKAVYTICLCVFNKWFPKLIFDVQSFHYMWGFGWKLMLSGLLANIWNQLYQVVVGKFYSPNTLGQYSRAKEYGMLFSAHFSGIVQRVTYPVLSTVQNDKNRLVDAYRRIIKTTMFPTAVCMFFLGAISEPLIYCLIGPKWSEAASYLPYISVSLSLYPLHAINLNMLQVQGRSDIYLYIEIAKKILAVGPLCIGIFINIYWMLVASIIFGIISFFMNSYYTGPSLGYSSWRQLKDVAPSFGVALIIALSVYFLKDLSLTNWIILPLQIIVGVTVGYGVCETANLDEYIEIKRIVLKYYSQIVKH